MYTFHKTYIYVLNFCTRVFCDFLKRGVYKNCLGWKINSNNFYYFRARSKYFWVI